MNKFNKKAVLTANTADICQRIVVRCKKTHIFIITCKALGISEIKAFDADKNTNQFQEPPFLEAKTAASCR